jgi:4-hydroxythreonine-4-phosphate dehydrogenase
VTRPLAITMGDPAGIGPEVALRALADPALAGLDLVLVAHRPTVEAVAGRLGRRESPPCR